jgi:hypothetical protein
MKIEIEKCAHKSGAVKMQRLYKREKGKFIPCAWRSPDCGQFKKDN